MNFAAVLGVLNDLPSTFLRPAPPYTQFVDATGTALTQFTAGADGMWTQALSFQNAVDGWLDVWGLLWAVPRNPGEGNIPYAIRVQETVLAWVGTVPAIQVWLNLFAAGGTVTENASGLGYVITFPAGMTSSEILLFFVSLQRIRPIGVPFTIQQTGTGLFAGTEAFTDSGSRVLGDYLSDTPASVAPPFGAMTLNTPPLLPALLLVDPTINPSFAPSG